MQDVALVSHSFSGSVNVTFTNCSLSVPGKAFVGVAGPTASVAFVDSALTRVSSQAFSDSHLRRLELRGCRVLELQPGALSLRLRSLDVQRCTLGALAADALTVRWSGTARLNNNTFAMVPAGAFSRLVPTGGSARFEFHDNRLLELDPGALALDVNLTPDQLSLQRLRTRQPCRCQLDDWLRLVSGADAPDWLVRRLVAAVRCLAEVDAETDTAFLSFLSRHCRPDELPPAPAPPLGWKRYLVGAAVAAALVTVLCAVSCFAAWRQTRQRRERRRGHAAAAAALRHRPHKLNNANLYADEPSGEPDRWGEPPESPRRPLVVAVPDVKTYTETELHVVLETLESLEPSVLPRSPSGTLHRLRDGPRAPAAGAEPQSPGCRKSCPL